MEETASPLHPSSGERAIMEETASPPRRPSSREEAASLIPTPIRNSIARVEPKESNPHFDREEIGDGGVMLHIYKTLGRVCISIPTGEVKDLISVTDQSPSWSNAFKSSRSNMFRKWVTPAVPAHIALTFDQSFCRAFSMGSGGKRGRGRPRMNGDLILGYTGYCAARSDGCPAIFVVGFSEDSMKTMLLEPLPPNIELVLVVEKACIHVKGHNYGQLRGSERHDVVDKFKEKKEKPFQFVKNQLTGATHPEFHSGNSSRTLSRKTSYNISREAKAETQLEHGLVRCKLTNIYLAQEITANEDTEERASCGDSSTDNAGILRSMELIPYFRMHMWVKSMLQIYYHLAQTGKLIIFADATGGLINLPQADKSVSKKILHVKLAISPRHPLTDKEHMRDKKVSLMLSPLTIAEMVSNKNQGEDVYKFHMAFLNDVNKLFPNKDAAVSPLLQLTDCSPALESGALLAFPSPHQTKPMTRIEYGNILLIYLLHYDKMMKDIESGALVSSANAVASNIVKALREQYHVGIFLKECKSHVYRAPPRWLKKSDKVPSHIKDRVGDVMRKAFSLILVENRISVAIVQMCIVISMFETEYFITPSFDHTMETKNHRGDAEMAAEACLTRSIDSFIQSESQKLLIHSIADVDKRLGDSQAMHQSHIRVHDQIVDSAKTQMQKQCCAYLKGVSLNNSDSAKNVGTLRCSIIYGRSVGSEVNGNMDPWKEGGLEVSVELPFSGSEGVKNPLYCPAVGEYIRSTWMLKTAYWCRGIVDLLETFKNMDIESSNQFLEGIIGNQKQNQDVYNHISEPARYVLHRYRDSQACSKHFIKEYDSLQGNITQMEKRQKNKRKREQEVAERLASAPPDEEVSTMVASALLTQDQLTQMDEEDEGEKWSRRGSPAEIDASLRNELSEAFGEIFQDLPNPPSNRKSYNHLESWLLTSTMPAKPKIMSYPTFNLFMNGKHEAKKGLKEPQRALLQHFLKGRNSTQKESVVPVASDNKTVSV